MGDPNNVVLGISAQDDASGPIDEAVSTFEAGTEAMSSAAEKGSQRIEEAANQADAAIGKQGAAARGGVEDLSALGRKAGDAAESVEALGGKAGETGGDLQRLGSDAGEAGDGLRKLGDDAEGATPKLDAAGEEVEQLSGRLERIHDAAKEAGEALEVSSAAIEKSTESATKQYAEAARAVDEFARAVQEAGKAGEIVPPEAVAALAEAQQRLEALKLAAAEAALDKVFVDVEAGASGASKELVFVAGYLKEMRAEVEALQAQGSPVSPESLASLEELEGRYKGVIKQMGDAQVEQKKIAEEVEKAGTKSAKTLSSIDDVLALGGPKWTAYGAKAFAALAAFEFGFGAGEKLRARLNDLGKELGKGEGAFDKWIASVSKSEEAAEAWVRVTSKATDETRQLEQATSLLEKAQVKHGASIEELTKDYQRFEEQLRKTKLEQLGQARLADELQQKLAGDTVADLTAGIQEVQAALKQFAASKRDIADLEGVFPGLYDKVFELSEAAEKLGVDVAPKVRDGLYGVLAAANEIEKSGPDGGRLAKLRNEMSELNTLGTTLGPTLGRGFVDALGEIDRAIDGVANGKDGSIDTLKATILSARNITEAASSGISEKTAKSLEEIKKLAPEIMASFRAVGVEGPRILDEAGKGLSRYVDAVGGVSGATQAQLTVIHGQVEDLAKSIDTLPEAQRPAVRELERQLEGYRDAIAASSAAALSAFGSRTPDAIRRSAQEIKSLLEGFGGFDKAGGEQVGAIRQKLEELRSEINLLSPESRAALGDVVKDLAALQDQAADSAAGVGLAFGIRTPEAIRRSAEEVRTLIATFGGLDKATGQQVEAVQGKLNDLREEIRRLPEAHRRAVDNVVADLDRWQEAAAKSGEAALRAFGVKAPEAIRTSVDQLRTFIDLVDGAGVVTQQSAAKIVASAKSWRDEIASLPPEQRAAFDDMDADLHRIELAYERTAKATEDQLRQWKIEVQEFARTFASEIDAIYKKLRETPETDGLKQSVAAVMQEIAALEAKGPNLELLDAERLTSLRQQLGGLQRGLADAGSGMAALGETSKQLTLSVQEASTFVEDTASQILALKDAANLSGETLSSLDQQFARFIETAKAGGLGAANFQNQVQAMKGTLRSAGVDMEEVDRILGGQGEKLGEAGVSWSKLKAEIERTGATQKKTAEAAEAAAASQDIGATKAKAATEARTEAAEMEEEAVGNAQKRYEEFELVLGRVLDVSLKIKQCWAETRV